MLFYFSRSDRVEWLLVDTWWRACKQLPLSIQNTVTLGPSKGEVSFQDFEFSISNTKFRFSTNKIASNFRSWISEFLGSTWNFAQLTENSTKFWLRAHKISPEISVIFRLNNSRNSFAFFLHSTVHVFFMKFMQGGGIVCFPLVSLRE